MTNLVPLAQRLVDLSGGPEAGLELAVQISRRGDSALGGFDDGQTLYLKGELRDKGVVHGDGHPSPVGAARLILVIEMLGQVFPSPAAAPLGGRLVFTSPEDLYALPAEQRLDLLVADIIRMSTSELHIGSGFWNEQGIDLILDVLVPAVRSRGVRAKLYAQDDSERQLERLRSEAVDLLDSTSLQVLFYQGPPNSLMHAKFVVADRERGYLGTANLTSLGFRHHIEVGVELTAIQADQLVGFIDHLAERGMFLDSDDCHATVMRPR